MIVDLGELSIEARCDYWREKCYNIKRQISELYDKYNSEEYMFERLVSEILDDLENLEKI